MIRGILVLTLSLLLALPARADGPDLPGRKKRIAGVVTVLAGAALLVAAAALVNQSADDSNSTSQLFAGGGVWNSQARATDAEGKRDNIAGAVLFPLAGLAMVAGVVVAVVGWRQDKHHHPLVAPVNGGAATSWAVTF